MSCEHNDNNESTTTALGVSPVILDAPTLWEGLSELVLRMRFTGRAPVVDEDIVVFCRHSSSCPACATAGEACGRHAVGDPGHTYCTGRTGVTGRRIVTDVLPL